MDGIPPAALLWRIRHDHTDIVGAGPDDSVGISDDHREYNDGHPDSNDVEIGRLTSSPGFPKPPTGDPVAV